MTQWKFKIWMWNIFSRNVWVCMVSSWALNRSVLFSFLCHFLPFPCVFTRTPKADRYTEWCDGLYYATIHMIFCPLIPFFLSNITHPHSAILVLTLCHTNIVQYVILTCPSPSTICHLKIAPYPSAIIISFSSSSAIMYLTPSRSF